jgi:hypothetical protein
LRFKRKTVPTKMAEAMITPITIPAIAPALIPSFSLEAEKEDGIVDESNVGVGDTAVTAALDEALLSVEAAELDVEDSAPPRTCASLTTLTPLLQQSALVPQHHVSLSAFPVHGVTCAFPPVPRDEAHISRHLPVE